MWLTSLGILLLLAMSFFFSGSETALTASSRARMHQLARSGEKRASLVEELTAEKERLIGAILLGNNIVNILASTLAASLLIQIFGEAGIAYATIAMTAAVVVFSEVLPKTLALIRPEAFALAVAPTIKFIVVVFAPVTLAVQALVNLILRRFGLDPDEAKLVSGHEEIRGTVDLLHSEGEVVKRDRDMLSGILNLRDLAVRDVMVHRTKMFSLDINQPVEQFIDAILDNAYTRVPVFDENPDEVIGIVHSKDVLRALLRTGGDASQLNIRKLTTQPWFVPESMSVEKQLSGFLKRHIHIAIVLSETGAVEGLVTLEDIIEEIVGEISDEHDEPEDDSTFGIDPQADGSYIIDGTLSIRDLNRSLDWDLPDDEVTTVAGIVISAAKRIPDVRQEILAYGYRFQVMEMDRHRVARVRVFPTKEAGSTGQT